MSKTQRRQQLEFADLQPWVRYADYELWRTPMPVRRIFDHEFLYVIKGWVRAQFGGREIVLQPGDLWIIEPGDPHAGFPEPTRTETYGVHFDYITREDAPRLRYPLRDERVLPRLRPRAQFPGGMILSGVYRSAVLPDLRVPFSRLVDAFHDRRAANVLRVRACWLELFNLLVGALATAGNAGGSLEKHRSRIERAVRFIDGHFAERLERNRLAERVDLSPTHLTHLFRRLTGRSPMEYQLHLRMQEARRLLREGVYKVREIARRVGYDDPYHFSRAFRKHVGYSPRSYRERLLRKASQ
jgi:AraC-like DNA-binding protein